ncbi:MAG: hypothetical protein KC543_01160 [Myxococcales bacterium]|nr:hypothetical protein [Myxococcales bacterium]
MRLVATTLNVLLALVYPFAVWWSLSHFGAREVGLVLIAVLLPALALRFRSAERAHLWPVLRLPLLVMGVLLLGVLFDDARYVLATPVLINLALLAAFASSLFGEMPIVERFARLQEPDLTEPKRAHCRQATVAWCVFFALNAAVTAALALAAPLSWWAAYTGGVAYGLMGLMFAGEYLVRHYRFREYGPGLHHRLLARLFPPRHGGDA